MNVYIVTSNYFNSGVFGVYSTMKRARQAFELFLIESNFEWEDTGEYNYQFTNEKGETFGAEIFSDYVDMEFVYGSLTDK